MPYDRRYNAHDFSEENLHLYGGGWGEGGIVTYDFGEERLKPSTAVRIVCFEKAKDDPPYQALHNWINKAQFTQGSEEPVFVTGTQDKITKILWDSETRINLG